MVCGCSGEEPVWEEPGRIRRNQSDYTDWQAEVISNEDGFGEYITFLENSLCLLYTSDAADDQWRV